MRRIVRVEFLLGMLVAVVAHAEPPAALRGVVGLGWGYGQSQHQVAGPVAGLLSLDATCAYYVTRARMPGTIGGHAWWATAVVMALHLFNSPWLSPT